MSLIHFLRKLRLLLTRKSFRDELNEEMEFHRAAAEQAFIEDGRTPEAARYASRRQFGSTTRLQEQSYEVIGFSAETVVQDLRFALRQLRRSPAFALTAILILALGMGANLAIFAFVDAALITPLPYPHPNRLVGVYSSISAGPMYCLSYLDFLDWKRDNRVLDRMEAYETQPVTLQTPTGGELARGVHVTSGFFRTLGIVPALGRDFHPGEEQPENARVVLLSYTVWQARYGGRADVLGKTVTFDNVPATIIGVLPKDFRFAPAEPAEYWSTLDPAGGCEKRRICHNLFAIARLKDGISVAGAQENLAAIAQRLEKQYPDSNRGQGAAVFSMKDVVVGDVRPLLLTLIIGTGLLLVIACVNVAGLLLMRSEQRRREMALRGALGASRVRLMRQFALEAAVLIAASCALGYTAAIVSVHLLPQLVPADMLAGMPYLQGIGITAHLAEYAIAIALIMWIAFASVPVLRLPAGDLRACLSEADRSVAGRAWRRLGSSFVMVELAAAILLLSGAGLLAKSVYRLLHVDTGMRADHLAFFSVGATPTVGSRNGEAEAVALGRAVQSQIAALPGVESVAITNSLPLRGYGPFFDFVIQGRPIRKGDHEEATLRRVSSNYFTAIGARIERGRFFSKVDTSTSLRVGVINRSFARRFFPGEDALGKRLVYTGPPRPPIEIVGIIDDIQEGELNAGNAPAFYELFDQSPSFWFSVVARTSQREASLLPLMVRAVHQVSTGIAVYEPGTMTQLIDQAPVTYLHRAAAWLAGGFAGMALLLGVVGLYGVIAYSVSQRTREIGVRMALGAQRATVYKMILIEAARLIAIGVGLGIAGSLATTSLLRPLLFGVRPIDIPILVGVAAVLGTAALLASYLPARRAASVNPVEALRAE
jgi:macrolide transport system ATP-binding/permease protein